MDCCYYFFTLYHVTVPYFTLWMLDFFKYHLGVKNSLDPDQARHFVGPDLGPICLQRFISRLRKLTLAGNKLHTKQPIGTAFWLKPWLKLISFGSWI